MGLRTEQVSVGGRDFKLTVLPTKRGARLLNRLLRITVPAAAKALGGKGMSLASLFKADLGGLADGVELLFSKLDENEQDHALNELFEGASAKIEGGKWAPLADVIEDQFAGKLDEMYQLAFKALKLNFASFLPALKSAISAAQNRAEIDLPTEKQ